MIDYLLIIIFWFLMHGVYNFVLIKNRINFTDRFYLTGIYYLSGIILLTYLFFDILKTYLDRINIYLLLLIPIFIGTAFLIRRFHKKLGERPTKLIKRLPGTTCFKLNPKFLIGRLFEILFQQVSYIIILTKLSSNFGYTYAIIIFTLLVGLLHSPIFFITKLKWSLLILLFSIIGGLLFSLIIINLHYGFFYSFLIHLAFWYFYPMLSWFRKT